MGRAMTGVWLARKASRFTIGTARPFFAAWSFLAIGETTPRSLPASPSPPMYAVPLRFDAATAATLPGTPKWPNAARSRLAFAAAASMASTRTDALRSRKGGGSMQS